MKTEENEILAEAEIESERIIGKIIGSEPGPTLVFTAGIHGNEPTGVWALENVFSELRKSDRAFNGVAYAIRGNLKALQKGVRYLDEDLNRIWYDSRVDQIDQLSSDSAEVEEQKALWKLLQDVFGEHQGPYYFFDLHTTSCETVPFITLNDTLLNRGYTRQYPIPVVLGIEEYLEGPLLSYLNELGYVAFGFEAGQHTDEKAVANNENFIWSTLAYTGFINATENERNHEKQLEVAAKGLRGFFEIYDYQPVDQVDKFEMKPGFKNFQRVEKGSSLAILNGVVLKAEDSTKIFMPLYQQQGDDGFFFVRKVAPFFLWLSKYARKSANILSFLPGVKWSDAERNTLLVNQKIARFFARPLFHLFGFRSRKLSANYYQMKNREAHAKHDEYKGAPWS